MGILAICALVCEVVIWRAHLFQIGGGDCGATAEQHNWEVAMSSMEGSNEGQVEIAQIQPSDPNSGEMDDLIVLQVTRSSKASNPQQEDIKPYLGESSEAPLQINEDLPNYVYNILSKSDFVQIGVGLEMATLVKAGLLRFVTLTSNTPPANSKLVQTFLEKYNPSERKAKFFKLVYILVDVENVAKTFGLPTGGASVLNLSNSDYNVAEGFLLRTILEELDLK